MSDSARQPLRHFEPLATPLGWAGLPITLELLPGQAEVGAMELPEAAVAVVRSGRGRRWWTTAGRTQEFYSAPGVAAFAEAGLCLDRARWDGIAGEVVMIQLPPCMVNRLVPPGRSQAPPKVVFLRASRLAKPQVPTRIGSAPTEIVPMSAVFSPPPAALPTDKELVLKVIPMPADTNGNGDIFGGWVMAQVDLAGSVLPARYIQGRMATVAVNEFIFKQPVRVGDILSFFSSITRVGNTSVTVEVEVYAERFTDQGRYVKVTEARLTYVAIDDQGRPRPVPKHNAPG